MSETWLLLFACTVGGSALGGLARHGLSGVVAARCGERFPLGTLAVNVTGAFLMGLVAFWPWETAGPVMAEPVRSFLAFGFLGGFTTVSSFSLQTLQLMEEGEMRRAAVNVVASVGLCLAAVAAGAALVRVIY